MVDLGEEIGEGTFSKVKLCTHLITGSQVKHLLNLGGNKNYAKVSNQVLWRFGKNFKRNQNSEEN